MNLSIISRIQPLIALPAISIWNAVVPSWQLMMPSVYLSVNFLKWSANSFSVYFSSKLRMIRPSGLVVYVIGMGPCVE